MHPVSPVGSNAAPSGSAHGSAIPITKGSGQQIGPGAPEEAPHVQPPEARFGIVRSGPRRTRSLSETGIRAQRSSIENEEVISLRDSGDFLKNLEEFFASHTLALHQEINSMKETVGELSASLLATENQKSNLERTVLERTEHANCAMSRENIIRELGEQNQGLKSSKSRSDSLTQEMQAAIDSMELKLTNLHDEISQKSKCINSQSNSIKKINCDLKKINISHYKTLEAKDRIIIDVKAKLKHLETELKAERQTTSSLQAQLEVINAAEKQFTPEKSKALVEAGQKITDQSQVLRALNTKLLEERKIMMAQNVRNKEQIVKLKGQLFEVAKLAGIELPESA